MMDQGLATILAALIGSVTTIVMALIASRPRRSDVIQVKQLDKNADPSRIARDSTASESPIASAATSTFDPSAIAASARAGRKCNGLAVPVLSAVSGGGATFSVAFAVAAAMHDLKSGLLAGLALSGIAGLGILVLLLRAKQRDGVPRLESGASPELIAGFGSMAAFFFLVLLAWQLGIFDSPVRTTPTDIIRSSGPARRP